MQEPRSPSITLTKATFQYGNKHEFLRENLPCAADQSNELAPLHVRPHALETALYWLKRLFDGGDIGIRTVAAVHRECRSWVKLGFLLVCSSDFPFAEGRGPTQSSHAHKPSCRARATAIFAIGGRKTDGRIRVKLRPRGRTELGPFFPQ